MTFYAGTLSRDEEFKGALLKDPLYIKSQKISSNYKPEDISISKTDSKEKWIAYNLINFNQLTYLLFSSFYDDCDHKTCPVMSNGSAYQYLWKDPTNPKYKKPTTVSAQIYCDLATQSITKYIKENELLLKCSKSEPLPKKIISDVKPMFKWMIRIFSHFFFDHQIKEKKFYNYLENSYKYLIHVRKMYH
eukprot:gene12011-5411_t